MTSEAQSLYIRQAEILVPTSMINSTKDDSYEIVLDEVEFADDNAGVAFSRLSRGMPPVGFPRLARRQFKKPKSIVFTLCFHVVLQTYVRIYSFIVQQTDLDYDEQMSSYTTKPAHTWKRITRKKPTHVRQLLLLCQCEVFRAWYVSIVDQSLKKPRQ